ncbi:uncharacterized protein LOC129923958 [Biomphalaria glabrata]|uniref:Uncharacterized protein LOC129923958 n=1 Tax=Biomphalaria glabrata TaxID=6526 RepID=A0A9W2ZEI8_BIOGL|nr:uncharacterized protein LOC129923958 [Biomphalaria glabrata]
MSPRATTILNPLVPSFINTSRTSAPSVDELKCWIKGNPMKNKNVYVLTDPEERDDRRFIVKENVFTDDRKFHNNKLLQGLKHEYLISYYGYIEESNLILTFFDYMPAGSLQDLYKQQGQIQESKCFNYAEQILEGLQYLHSRRIAHMNIRCETIVFETEDKLRIAGLSHVIIGRKRISSADYGKERWTAPEVFNEAYGHGFYDYQSDIWSLGCTIVEMLTAACPYAYEKYLPSVVITIGNGIPPETGRSLSTRMKNLLQNTLCADPSKRTEASEILKILRDVDGDIYLPVDRIPSTSQV